MLRRYTRLFRYFLIAAGLTFYAHLGAEYVLLLVGVAVLNWGCVRLLDDAATDRQRTWLVTADITIHVLLLAFFKYAEPFFLLLNDSLGAESPVRQWLMSSGFSDIVLPAGLSFYSFQGISYVIDHYRNREQAARGFVDVLAYISFFPTVMAGPILREHEFFPQLAPPRRNQRAFNEGMAYILSGLFKKVVLATYLAEQLVDPLFQTPEDYASTTALLGIYAYSAQIFCDFSGYTDLAIGIARLMGFNLPRNFDCPYRSLNMQEFWRRWHISLSRWLRDYLYIPMGGSRRGNRYFNLIVTMLIGGLWHGNGLNFMIWGFFHGVGMAIVHAFHQLRARLFTLHTPQSGFPTACGKLLAWLLTFHFVTLLWVFFRAETPQNALAVLRSVTCTHESSPCPIQVPVIIALVLALQWCGPFCFRLYVSLQARLPWYLQATLTAFFGGLILNLGPEGMLPFIYFNF